MVIPLHFNALSQADQADLLQAEGAFLNTRLEDEFIVDRYQLRNFYVDVFYRADSYDPVVVKSFYLERQQSPIYQMQLPRMYVRQGA